MKSASRSALQMHSMQVKFKVTCTPTQISPEICIPYIYFYRDTIPYRKTRCETRRNSRGSTSPFPVSCQNTIATRRDAIQRRTNKLAIGVYPARDDQIKYYREITHTHSNRQSSCFSRSDRYACRRYAYVKRIVFNATLSFWQTTTLR